MKQLDLFEWADNRPKAEVIDLMPHVIRNLCSQANPFAIKNGDVVPLKRTVA